MDGDTIVVATKAANNPDGSVYIFEKESTNWNYKQAINVDILANVSTSHGTNIKIDNDVILITINPFLDINSFFSGI